MKKPTFNCIRYLPRCHACGCGAVPIPRATWESRQADLQGPAALVEHDGQGGIFQATANGDCCFLRADFGCAIYPKEGEADPRPEVCRLMGHHPSLPCAWQDSDGRERPRRERRALLREAAETAQRGIARAKEAQRRAWRPKAGDQYL